MSFAASLSNRIVIEKQGADQDAAGQPVTTWSTFASLWGDIRNQAGLEAIKADAATSVVKASIRIRFRTDIVAGMRARYSGLTYRIVAVLPDFATRRHTDLVCEVVK